jgi:hypothetical protein
MDAQPVGQLVLSSPRGTRIGSIGVLLFIESIATVVTLHNN